MRESLKLKVLPTNPCEVDFTWYNMIRAELLRQTVRRPEQVLDVGCRRGEVLLMLSKQIKHGIGVDISTDDVVIAENMRKKKDINNLDFMHANAINLPFASKTFDVVLFLGDVLWYLDQHEQELALTEIKRVLRDDGLTVYEGTNWDWEYKTSPYWTRFTRTDDDCFHFIQSKRAASGYETGSDYEVVPDTPLHNWILQQDWPVNPEGYNTTLDVIEEEPIPECWLKFQSVDRSQYDTPRTLRKKYKDVGFRDIEVFAYGQTYDIVNKAGLLETIGQWKAELAKAEAEMIFQLRMGSGPWILLVARG